MSAPLAVRPLRVLVALTALCILAPARPAGAAPPDLESHILQELRSQNPAAADLFERGNVAREAGDHQRAAGLYHDVRVVAPRFSHAWRREGYELFSLGRRPDAIACMRTAVELERSAWNLLGLASVLSVETGAEPPTEGEIAEAVTLLREAESKEESPEMARLGCRLALQTQDAERLRVESERYLRLAPSDPLAHFFAAIHSQMAGDLGEARWHAEQARQFGLPEQTLDYLESKLDTLEAATTGPAQGDGRWLRWIVVGAFLGFLGVGALLHARPIAGRPEPTAPGPTATGPTATATAQPPAPAAARPVALAIPILTGLTLLLLLPFIGKAFHIDDPLFVWAAKQIESKPLDPYGFEVNWYGLPMPMWDVTKNPPLTSYFMAGVAKVAGMSEAAVHIAFLAQAVLVVLGTYWLARKLCARPLLAAVTALCTPVFLVSSSTVMSDTLMLAFWMAAVYAWMTGLERGSWARLLVSSLCVALGALSKYFAISLIPLLVVYTLAVKRRATKEMAFLLVSVAILGLYHLATQQLYGRGLLSDAASYASTYQEVMAGWLPARLLIGACFTGGCLGLVWLLAFFPWRRSSGAVAAGALLAGAAVAAGIGMLVGRPIAEGSGYPWTVAPNAGLFATVLLFAAGGAVVLFLCGRALLIERDPASLLLGLWALGTFGFAILVNWTINGRSILPMVPAVAILLARRMEGAPGPAPRRRLIPILAAAALLALGVTRADSLQANSARRAADEIDQRYGSRPGRHWFWGHWGFQYYMQQEGWSPIHRELRGVRPGDLVVTPTYNTNVLRMPSGTTQALGTFAAPVGGWFATMRQDMGASFYADVLGPLPFAMGRVGPEPYTVAVVVGPTTAERGR